MTADRPLTILFVLQYPLYLRHYEGVIRLLVERGHTVFLAYDTPHKLAEGEVALRDLRNRVHIVGAIPRRHDRWAHAARSIRGAVDYGRYLHPRYRQSHYLRGRMAKALTPTFRFMLNIPSLQPGVLRIFLKILLFCENAIPSNRKIEQFIESFNPDVVLLTPLVNKLSSQTDIVKSASALGIPTGLCVGSWDHLTTKGLIRIEPDMIVVWNETQRREATELHYLPPEKIIVTGAQTFDHWFGREPSTTREAFCRKVGLPYDKPFVLFVGSTASISAPDAEERFVRRWIAALRASNDPRIRDLSVLVRPHPYNLGNWATVDLTDLGHAVVWPRCRANPVDEESRSEYFDSLYHSVAVVGINTSAMIEAAILGRPVLTILDPEFSDTQDGTLHFQYLRPENGGCVHIASSFDEHVQQLAAVCTRPGEAQALARRFVESFVRPNGVHQPCTPLVVEAIEQLARRGRHRPSGIAPYLVPITGLLWCCSLIAELRDWPRTRRRVAKVGHRAIASVRARLRPVRRWWRQGQAEPSSRSSSEHETP